MKALALFLALAATSAAQQVAPLMTRETIAWGSKLSLDVRNIGSGSKMRDSYPTWWGSYDKKWTKTRDIEIAIHNLGGAIARMQVQIVWTGKTISSHDRVILQRGTEDLALNTNQTLKFVVGISADMSDFNLSTLGYRTTEGARIEGWVVTVRDKTKPSPWNGKVGTLIAAKASEEVLLRLAQTPGAMDALSPPQ